MQIILWDHYNAGMGGIEKLIVTLARDLAARFEIVVIAHKRSTVANILDSMQTPYSLVDPDSIADSPQLSSDSLLIDFGTFREFASLAHINPRLLLWRVFPELGFRNDLEFMLMRRSLRLLDRRSSLFFMDPGCHETTCRELGRNVTRRLLPLPMIRRPRRTPRPPGSVFNITYIGRGDCIWKVKPVKKLVADLCSMPELQFHVYVFTDTEHLFEEELSGLKGKNVEVSYLFGYRMESLSTKLAELSDLHYSMAMACLEGAVLGIPSIIADGAYSDFPENYRYRWFIEDRDNYAGVFLEKTMPEGHTLREIIDTVHDPAQCLQVSDATYEAVLADFSSEKVARTIEAQQPRARLNDVLLFMPSYWRAGGPFLRLLKRRALTYG